MLQWKRTLVTPVVLALVALAGCGGSGSASPAPAASASPAPAAPSPSQPAAVVKISFWHAMGGPQGDALKKIVADFNAKYQGRIQVSEAFQGGYNEMNHKILAAVTSMTTPTIGQMTDDIAAKLADSKALVPLQKYIDADPEFKAELGNIPKAFLQSGQFAGQQVLVPFNRSVQVLFVNSDLVKDQPKTVEDFHRLAKEATKGNVHGTAYNPDVDYFDIFFRMMGGEWLDSSGKAAFNSEAGQRALQLIVDMSKDGSAMQMEPKHYQSDYFAQQSIALFAGTSASMGYVDPEHKLHWTVYPLPRDKVAASPSFGTNIGIFVNTRPEEQKAAAEFLKFLLSPDSMAYWAIKTGYLPINTRAQDTAAWKDFAANNPAQAVPATVGDSVVFQPVLAQWNAARTIISQAVATAVKGDKSVKDALDEAARQVNDALAKK